MKNDLVKVTVNLTEENRKILDELSEELQVNKTTVINRGIELEKFISDIQKKDQTLIIQDKNGKMKEIIFR